MINEFCGSRCNSEEIVILVILGLMALLLIGLIAALVYWVTDEVFAVNAAESEAVVTYKTGEHEEPHTVMVGSNNVMVPVKTGGGTKYKIVAKINNPPHACHGEHVEADVSLVEFSQIKIGQKVTLAYAVGRLSGAICNVEVTELNWEGRT